MIDEMVNEISQAISLCRNYYEVPVCEACRLYTAFEVDES